MTEQGTELFADLRPARGRLFVVSGPSGVGKDAVLEALFASKQCPEGLRRCVTATTRPPRAGEIDGHDYFFFTCREFEERIAAGFFLEHAAYNQDCYGTPADYVARARDQGEDVLLKIEVQGAFQVKERLPEAILIFLAPPSWEELERRLRMRATDDEAKVARRLAIARDEMQAAPHYNYLVINDRIADAADRLRAIILAERARVERGEALGVRR